MAYIFLLSTRCRFSPKKFLQRYSNLGHLWVMQYNTSTEFVHVVKFSGRFSNNKHLGMLVLVIGRRYIVTTTCLSQGSCAGLAVYTFAHWQRCLHYYYHYRRHFFCFVLTSNNTHHWVHDCFLCAEVQNLLRFLMI